MDTNDNLHIEATGAQICQCVIMTYAQWLILDDLKIGTHMMATVGDMSHIATGIRGNEIEHMTVMSTNYSDLNGSKTKIWEKMLYGETTVKASFQI